MSHRRPVLFERGISRRAALKVGASWTVMSLIAVCRPVAVPDAQPPVSSEPEAVVTPAAAAVPGGGTYVVFDLCIRDGACAAVCPVECIIPGQPPEDWPWYYVDPDTCIECGACVPECPVDAIRPAEEVPEQYSAAIELNARFFTEGPGYAASGM